MEIKIHPALLLKYILNLLKRNFYVIKNLIFYLIQSLTKGRGKTQKSPPEEDPPLEEKLKTSA